MSFLRQSTEQVVMLGPFLDKTDGVTEETGLGGGGTEISKDGGAYGTGPVLGTHDSEGEYPVTLTTTHTDTVGILKIKSYLAATHLPVWHEFTVVEEAVYDALYAASAAGPNVVVPDAAGVAPTAVENRAEMDSNSTQFAAIVGDTNELQLKLVGITLHNEWLGAIAGDQNADATALTEIRASGAGSGTYDPNNDSIEAIRARGDAAWPTATGFNTTTPPTVGQIQTELEENGASLLDTIRDELANGTDGLTALKALIDTAQSDLDIITGASGVVIANGEITAAKFGAGAIDAGAIATDAGQELADRLLFRNIAGGADGTRTVQDALRALRNKVTIAGGTMTVKKEDDSTTAWTGAVTTASGDPISEIDPA